MTYQDNESTGLFSGDAVMDVGKPRGADAPDSVRAAGGKFGILAVVIFLQAVVIVCLAVSLIRTGKGGQAQDENHVERMWQRASNYSIPGTDKMLPTSICLPQGYIPEEGVDELGYLWVSAGCVCKDGWADYRPGLTLEEFDEVMEIIFNQVDSKHNISTFKYVECSGSLDEAESLEAGVRGNESDR